MTLHGIQLSESALADFCKRNGIARLSLFGSILRDDFTGDSDVDLLAEFEPGQTPSLFGMAGLEIKLTAMLGRKVDLRTPAEISHHFRQQVLREAQPQYVAT